MDRRWSGLLPTGGLLSQACKVVAEAIKGESWAVHMVADRLDGKPAQESALTVNKMDRDCQRMDRAEIANTSTSLDQWRKW
jgi:hypothetical protein